jgi:hypothetical protein
MQRHSARARLRVFFANKPLESIALNWIIAPVAALLGASPDQKEKPMPRGIGLRNDQSLHRPFFREGLKTNPVIS